MEWFVLGDSRCGSLTTPTWNLVCNLKCNSEEEFNSVHRLLKQEYPHAEIINFKNASNEQKYVCVTS